MSVAAGLSKGPPKDIAPDALWLQLQALPRPQRLVDYPRIDPITNQPIGKVTIRVLSQAEQMSAAAAAEKYTVDLLKRKVGSDERSDGYTTIYNNECSVQLLFRAVYRAKQVDSTTWEPDALPFFPSPDSIRGNDAGNGLTQDEIGALIRMYLIVQRELGPIVSRMGKGEMEEWVKRLVEGGSVHPLALLDSEAVNDLVMHMASLLYPYLTDTTLSGSQPDSSMESGLDPETSPNS
jgi:hypothetical protein